MPALIKTYANQWLTGYEIICECDNPFPWEADCDVGYTIDYIN